MHTSTALTADDFTYWHVTSGGREQYPFTKFCIDYHQLDRIGVVSPGIEEGIIYAGRTLLAFTTAFYDCLRARGVEFFDYPQHFAFVGSDDVERHAQVTDLWRAWSLLDVWPNNKWIATTPTATDMLKRAFDYQINRLIWPYDLRPQPGEELLPDYAYRMLRTHVKSVYYYCPTGSLDGTVPVVEVHGSATAEGVLQKSIEQLPEVVRQERGCQVSAVDRLWPVSIDDFLATMRGA